jgi:hypothetical protein
MRELNEAREGRRMREYFLVLDDGSKTTFRDISLVDDSQT